MDAAEVDRAPGGGDGLGPGPARRDTWRMSATARSAAAADERRGGYAGAPVISARWRYSSAWTPPRSTARRAAVTAWPKPRAPRGGRPDCSTLPRRGDAARARSDRPPPHRSGRLRRNVRCRVRSAPRDCPASGAGWHHRRAPPHRGARRARARSRRSAPPSRRRLPAIGRAAAPESPMVGARPGASEGIERDHMATLRA